MKKSGKWLCFLCLALGSFFGLLMYTPIGFFLPTKVAHIELQNARGTLLKGSVDLKGMENKTMHLFWALTQGQWVISMGGRDVKQAIHLMGSWDFQLQEGLILSINKGMSSEQQTEQWANFSLGGLGKSWGAKAITLDWTNGSTQGWSLASLIKNVKGTVNLRVNSLELLSWLPGRGIGDAHISITKDVDFQLGAKIKSEETLLLDGSCQSVRIQNASLMCPFEASWDSPPDLYKMTQAMKFPSSAKKHQGTITLKLMP